jgi:cell division ATPase FtsA
MNFFGEKKDEIIAVINVGSASVGGMMVKKTAGNPPEIITSAKVPVNFLMDVDYDAFWRCTFDSLKKVVKKLLEDYSKGPDKVLCVFSSLWGISQTRVIKVRKEEPFEITKEFLDKLIDSEIKIFQAQWHSKIPYFKNDSELIEQETIKTLLNGYNVKNPFNKKTRNADFFVHMSLVVRGVKDAMEKNFLENFGNVPVIFHTLPFVVFSSLKNLVNAEEGFIFADVGGETSDISFVRKNILEETVSFPRGRNFLTRNIAKEFKTFIDEAKSLLASFRRGDLNQSALQKARPVIDSAKKEWCDFTEKALEEISQKTPLPMSFFLVDDADTGPEFAECLKNESFSKFTILGRPFEVKQISADALKHNFKFLRSFAQDNDVFLMLISLFADKNL